MLKSEIPNRNSRVPPPRPALLLGVNLGDLALPLLGVK